MPISDFIERVKQQREAAAKPFPLWALLYIVEVSSRRDWYPQYFEGFKLLRDWLSPIDIQEAPQNTHIPVLMRTYEIQEIAKHLNTSQENIYYGYQTAQLVIQQLTNTAFMPAEIPIIPPQFKGKRE